MNRKVSERRGGHMKGVITAISHILQTNPRIFFIELETENDVILILVKHYHQHSWQTELQPGLCYNFTHLDFTWVEYQNKRIPTWVPSVACLCFLEAEMCKIPSQLKEPHIHYQGVVTKVEPLFSLYELNHEIQLCLAFIDKRSMCPRLCVGQTVSVYNAHLGRNNSGGSCLILCGRGFLKIISNEKTEVPKYNQAPLALTAAIMKIGYSDFLTLGKLIPIFEEKFTDDFLTSTGVQNPSEVRSALLVQSIIKSTARDDYVVSNSVALEFAAFPHQCIIFHEAKLNPKITTLADFVDQVKQQTCITNSTSIWGHAVKPMSSEVAALVGFLSVSGQTGSWVLSDATYKLDCIISGPDSMFPDVSLQFHFYKVMVLIKRYTVAIEEFEVKNNDVSANEMKIYLHCMFDDICWLQNPLLRRDDLMISLQSNTTEDNMNDTVGASNCVNDTDKITEEASEKSNSCLANKTNGIQILLHQKSSIMRISANKPPQCCLLVSLIYNNQKTDDATSLDTIAQPTKRYILILKGPFLKMVPFLQIGNMHFIYFPSEHQLDSLLKRCKPDSLFSVVPHVGVLHLPVGSRICLLEPHTSYHDWYSISDVQAIPCGEILNVEGIIYDCLHIVPTFHKEQKSLNLLGFGIPGMRTVVLKLRDMKTNDSICLYINDWANCQYPLGIVLGAHICATFVKKVGSKTEYLVCTTLTRIEILALNMLQVNECIPRLSWDNLLHCDTSVRVGSVISLVIRPMILKVELKAVCTQCNSSVENNMCTSTACSSKAPATILAKAWCIHNSLNSKVKVYFKDTLVRKLLGIPDDIWKVLTTFLKKKSEVTFLHSGKKMLHDQPLFDMVMHMFCTVVSCQRSFVVRCRVMKSDDNQMLPKDQFCTTSNDGPSLMLFCLDIQDMNSYFRQNIMQLLSM